jgi:hypothetical protein
MEVAQSELTASRNECAEKEQQIKDLEKKKEDVSSACIYLVSFARWRGPAWCPHMQP